MTDSKYKRLKQTKFKLDTILNVTNAINANKSVKELITIFQNVLIEDLNIGKVSIYRFNGNRWKSILDVGIKKRYLKDFDFNIFDKNDIQIKSSRDINNDKIKKYDFIIPVYHKNTPLAYVFIGDIDEENIGMSPSVKHINFIQILANILMVAIENKRLFRDSIKQIAIKKEMELAAKMQKMLIPSNQQLQKNQHINMYAFYKPYSQIGGDYYDYIELDKNNIVFCIADVSGKGTSAAILMSNFQANLRALITPEIPLPELIIKLNKRIIDLTNNDKFITLFLGRYNYKTKQLSYINCGHLPPIMYCAKTDKIELLKKGTIGIGMLKTIPIINVGSKIIDSGKRIICFTDGVSETENEKNEEFGTSQIEIELKKNNKLDKTINSIITKLNNYNKKVDIFDDVTILGIDLF